MPRAGVLGSPVSHSLSPVLHRAAYAALGLTGWTYEAIECTAERLEALLDGLDEEWVGLSLTMPLKRRALEVADEATGLARAVGAANTLLLSRDATGRQLRTADNTDVGGMADALAAAGPVDAADVGRAVIVGAGGTAQAALAALEQMGVADVAVLARDLSRTRELLAAADRIGVRPHLVRWTPDGGAGPADEQVREILHGADLVISTVPMGAADALADVGLDAGTVLLDVVYDPWPTPLAAAAATAGARVVSGLDLLVHQAVRQVRLMTGHGIDPAVMYRAVAE